MTTRRSAKATKGAEERVSRTNSVLEAIGLEAEFAVVLDGHPAKPEDVFGSPTQIVRAPMMHRVGRSYHLPTGGAIYFDTGVIEVATPLIEIEPGCAARAGRSLWEGIHFLRDELDAWEDREGHNIRLAGFSTHYNVSFDQPEKGSRAARTAAKLAMLLTHILPVPVMLLAANRRSTGVGVRPRADRIEVTADFTPDAALMIAAATVIVGIARDVMQWASFELSELDDRDFPVVRDFAPETHSSRKGWVARFSSFAENPFVADVGAPIWTTRDGETMSLRKIARRITGYFWTTISSLSDPRSLRLIASIMQGRSQSLLELDDRPDAYDDVGRCCTWADLFPVRALSRSRYERAFIGALSSRKLRLSGDSYTPVGTRGWSHVVFRRDRDGTRHEFSLTFLLDHVDAWDAGRAARGHAGGDKRRTSRATRPNRG